MPVVSPGCQLSFLLTGYWWEVSRTASWGLINLLECLKELMETFYLLDFQFFIKEYNLKSARWKICIGQSMGKGCGDFVLSGHTIYPESPYVHKLRSSQTPIHSFQFLWKLHYICHLWSQDIWWLNSISRLSLLSRGQKMALKFLTLSYMVGSPGYQPCHMFCGNF